MINVFYTNNTDSGLDARKTLKFVMLQDKFKHFANGIPRGIMASDIQ